MRNEFRLAASVLLAGLAVVGFGQAHDPVDQYYECIRKNDLAMLHALASFCRETGENVNRRPKYCIDRVSLFQLYG